MYNGMKTGVLIAASGVGKRLGASVPKQFLPIEGEPMVVRALRPFLAHEAVDEIVCAVTPGWEDTLSGMLEKAGAGDVKIASGGDERQDSVRNGLAAFGPDIELILIHDGARPYVSRAVIDRVLAAAAERGAATAAVRAKDTVRRERADGSTETLDRGSLWQVQTPQGFRRDILEDAYGKAEADGYLGTDDTVLCERAGYDVAIAEGEYVNYKITTAEDMPRETRTGIGYDVHRLVPGRKLILGGVEIPYELGLDGHSDADVLTHAVMDALLGAAGLGDIGKHFPDTDDRYLGISSIELLRQVGEKLGEAGFSIVNVDAVLIAQKPKIAPHTDEMRANMAGALGISGAKINIKGTTTEKLGFTGRGEGMAAQAVCTVQGIH